MVDNQPSMTQLPYHNNLINNLDNLLSENFDIFKFHNDCFANSIFFLTSSRFPKKKPSKVKPKTQTKPLLKKCVELFSSCPIDSFLHSHAIVFVRKQPSWFFLGCKDVVSGQGWFNGILPLKQLMRTLPGDQTGIISASQSADLPPDWNVLTSRQDRTAMCNPALAIPPASLSCHPGKGIPINSLHLPYLQFTHLISLASTIPATQNLHRVPNAFRPCQKTKVNPESGLRMGLKAIEARWSTPASC